MTFRKTIIAFVAAFGASAALLQWIGYMDLVGVSIGEVLLAIPVEIAVPVLLFVAVMFILNPSSNSS